MTDSTAFAFEKANVRIPLFIAVFLYVGLIAFVFFETFNSLHTLWTKNNEAYSHGYILVLFVFYALSVKREWLQVNPSFLAPILGLMVGLAWVMANSVQVMLLQQMMMPLLLVTVLLSIVGIKNVIKIAAPLVGLYLAIPVMDFFLKSLQDLTTFVVSSGVKTVGITAYIEQYDIQLPFGTLRIAGGCAGLNYMLAGLSIGLFYAYLNFNRKRDYVLSISLIVVIALIGNWIRVFALVLVGYFSEMQSPLIEDHGFFGWIIFAILVIGYFVFMEGYSRKLSEKEDENEVLGKELKEERLNRGEVKNTKFATLTCIASAVAIVFFPLFSKFSVTDIAETSRLEFSFPSKIDTPEPLNTIQVEQLGGRFVGSDREDVFAMRFVDQNAYLAVVTYFSQEQGKELIYYANSPILVPREKAVVSVGGVSLNRAQSTNGNYLALWLYRVADDYSHTDLGVKLLQLKHALKPAMVHAIVLYVECERRCENIDEAYLSEHDVIGVMTGMEITKG